MIYSGLDLGKLQDHTAWVINDMDVSGDKPRHRIMTVKQWPVGTYYEVIRDQITAFIIDHNIGNHVMGVESNSVGEYVVEMFRKLVPARIVGVCTTVGANITTGQGTDDLRAGKGHILISCLQAIISGNRLGIANVPHRETLMKELELFQIKISKAGNETFEALSKTHDDTVMATAICLWLSEYGGYHGSSHLSTVSTQGIPQQKLERALGNSVSVRATREGLAEAVSHSIFGVQGRPFAASNRKNGGPQPERRQRFRRW